MKKLLLFDIDGTLVTSKNVRRFTRTINKVHNLNISSDKDFSGYTDYLILVELLENEGWYDHQIAEAMPTLLKELDKAHQETFHADDLTLLPGVKDLLEAIDTNKAILGLVTGNLKSVAQRKLEAVGIWPYFTVGGFGSDPHTIRGDLVRLAAKRAGYENHLEKVYIIGDTPLDIQAAQRAGVAHSVGVANGFRDIQELIDAGAEIVLKDFTNTQEVLSVLGIN